MKTNSTQAFSSETFQKLLDSGSRGVHLSVIAKMEKISIQAARPAAIRQGLLVVKRKSGNPTPHTKVVLPSLASTTF